MSLSATNDKLKEALQKVITHDECNARSIFLTKKDMRKFLAAIPMEDPATDIYNFSVTLYRDNEWTNLKHIQIVNPNAANPGQPAMLPGPVWVPPTNPGRPTGNSYAAQDQWRWEREIYKEYDLVLTWERDAIQKAFKDKTLLMCKEDALGNLTHHHPLDLLEYLWQTRSNQRQIDVLIEEGKKDLQVEYDPSEEVTVYFKKLEDARYILIELSQNHLVTDVGLIRISLLELEKHDDWEKPAEKFRKKQAAGAVTWEELKEDMIKEETDRMSKSTTKKDLNLANSAMELVQRQGHELEDMQTLAIAQNQKIMEMQQKMEAMEQKQESHQANAAFAAAAAAAAAAPTPQASNVTQPAASTQTDLVQQLIQALNTNNKNGNNNNNNSNRNSNKVKFVNQPNDLIDGQRSKRRYPESMAYCSTCGFDVHPRHGDGGNCRQSRANPNHNPNARASNTMGGSQRNMHLYYEAIGQPFKLPAKKSGN